MWPGISIFYESYSSLHTYIHRVNTLNAHIQCTLTQTVQSQNTLNRSLSRTNAHTHKHAHTHPHPLDKCSLSFLHTTISLGLIHTYEQSVHASKTFRGMLVFPLVVNTSYTRTATTHNKHTNPTNKTWRASNYRR